MAFRSQTGVLSEDRAEAQLAGWAGHESGIASRRINTRRPRQHFIDYRLLLSDTGHVSLPRRFVCIDKVSVRMIPVPLADAYWCPVVSNVVGWRAFPHAATARTGAVRHKQQLKRARSSAVTFMQTPSSTDRNSCIQTTVEQATKHYRIICTVISHSMIPVQAKNSNLFC